MKGLLTILVEEEASLSDLTLEEAVWCICLNVFPGLSGRTLLDSIHEMNAWFLAHACKAHRFYNTELAMLRDTSIDDKEIASILASAECCSLPS